MRGMSKSAFDPTETCVLERMLLCLAKWSEQVWSRIEGDTWPPSHLVRR